MIAYSRLRKRLPRPRKEPIVNASVLISSILVGAVMAAVLLWLIQHGFAARCRLAPLRGLARRSAIVCRQPGRRSTGGSARRSSPRLG